MSSLCTAPAAMQLRPVGFSEGEQANTGRGTPHEVLTFRVGREEYAMDILRVQEIRSHGRLTRIAHAPSNVLGVLDLRGVIVPVMDLRGYLMAEPLTSADDGVTVIVDLGARVVGVVVDSVCDVLSLKASDLRPAPQLGRTEISDALLGLASLGDAASRRTLIVIDIECLLAKAGLGV